MAPLPAQSAIRPPSGHPPPPGGSRAQLQALYLVGVPGAGKSTLFRATVQACCGPPLQRCQQPVPHAHYAPGQLELGSDRPGPHPGTDALPHHAITPTLAWLRRCYPPLLLAEGDRLANDVFFGHLVAMGYALTVAWLDTPSWDAANRRMARAPAISQAWLRGRSTKVRNLASRWATDYAYHLDGTLPVATLAQQLAQHPIFHPQEQRDGHPIQCH